MVAVAEMAVKAQPNPEELSKRVWESHSCEFDLGGQFFVMEKPTHLASTGVFGVVRGGIIKEISAIIIHLGTFK